MDSLAFRNARIYRCQNSITGLVSGTEYEVDFDVVVVVLVVAVVVVVVVLVVESVVVVVVVVLVVVSALVAIVSDSLALPIALTTLHNGCDGPEMDPKRDK